MYKLTIMLERIQFTWKDKPYEVLSTAKTKIDGEWIHSIVYVSLYNNEDGEVWVKTEKDEEWELFKEIVTKSREVRAGRLQSSLDIVEIRRSGRTTRMADAYIQELFEKKAIVVRDHYNDTMRHAFLFHLIIERLGREHGRIAFVTDRTKLQISLTSA